MKKQQNVKHTALHIFDALLAIFLISFASCKKPKIEDEKEPRVYELHTEETEGKVVVSEKYVPVDWDKSTNEVLTANAETGEFTMNMSKEESKDIKKGSLMTIDVDSTMYLVKVSDYKIVGDKVELQTEQAALADVFAGSSFELVMGDIDLEDIDRRSAEYVAPEKAEDYEDDFLTRAMSLEERLIDIQEERAKALGSKLKIYPSEFRYMDEKGEIHKVPMGGTRVDLPPLTHKFNIDIPFGKDDGAGKMGNYSFAAGLKGSASFSLQFGASLFADLPEEYAETANEENQEDIELANSSKFKPTFKVNPSIDWSVSFYSKITKHFTSDPVLLDEIKLASFKFMVGIVPVYVAVYNGFYVSAEGEISGGLDVSLSGHGGCDVEYYAGFAVGDGLGSDGGWGARAFRGGGPFTHTTSWPTTQISVGEDVKVKFTADLGMTIYDCIGPKIEITPYVEASINAGVGVVANFEDGPEGIIDWDAGLDLGAEWTGGIKLGAGKIKKLLSRIIKKDVTLPAQQIKSLSLSLAAAPAGITCENGSNIKFGAENTVEFSTYWMIMGGKAPLWIPVYVYFEASGNELFEIGEEDFSIAKKTMVLRTEGGNGKVKIGWQPMTPTSTLTATIYDGNGKIRGTTTVKANTAPDKIQAVDLGVSVLWANMNVGADNDREPGDLVGWGDNSGTHTQQWNFESYGSYKENAVYSLKYYGGPNLDRSGIAHTRHDYATAKWGSEWRMPTEKQWKELMKKCEWEWDDERTAYKVTGSNGNYIYLPAAGYRIGTRKFNQGLSSELGEEKASCEYWSSTMDLKTTEELNASYIDLGVTVDKIYPNAMYFYAEHSGGKDKKMRTASTPKYYGQSVRPVFPNPNFGK